jgi:hypothetical protein
MATASGCESGWHVNGNGRGTSLVVELRQRSYVFPWSLFLYAEGTAAEVRAVFHTHVVRMEGAGLSFLLQAFAKQTVACIQEPDRTAKFGNQTGPHLSVVTVSENK